MAEWGYHVVPCERVTGGAHGVCRKRSGGDGSGNGSDNACQERAACAASTVW